MSRQELITLLTKLLGPLTPMVLSQIDKFTKQGLTYKDIARSAYYIYDVKRKVQIDSIQQWGIGLVPTYVREANRYYDDIKKQQEAQKQQVIAAKDISQKMVVPQPRVKRKREIDINELK